VCGEHTITINFLIQYSGSSPRVRGTPASAATLDCGSRFIPACAGNTSRSAQQSGAIPVHPRVCGEHKCRLAIRNPDCGSSPRVRGTLEVSVEGQFNNRFIPACAGNTHPIPNQGGQGAVHPRVCGEHSLP